MLRLDPAFPPLWRSPVELQFGLDPVVVLADPPPWQQRLVRELEQGLPAEAVEAVALTFGAPPGRAAVFLHLIRPALERPAPPFPSRVVVQLSDDVPPAAADAIVAALLADQMAVQVQWWPDLPPEPLPAAVIVVARHLVHPQRAAALVGADVRHLPLILAGSRIHVGPVIDPGRTACLSCLALAATAADPLWPVLAAQLAGRRMAGNTPLPLIGEAAHRAVRLLSGEGTTADGSTELVLTTSPAPIETRHHLPAAACGCRSPAGIATDADRGSPVPRTPPVFARPA